MDGDNDELGDTDGDSLGLKLGLREGLLDGDTDGDRLGDILGDKDGLILGDSETPPISRIILLPVSNKKDDPLSIKRK